MSLQDHVKLQEVSTMFIPQRAMLTKWPYEEHGNFWLLAQEEVKLQLSSVVPNPVSSDTSCLHHATKVQPKQDQSHNLRGMGGIVGAMSFFPGTQDRPSGPISKKDWWWHRQNNQWLEGSEDYNETDHSEQRGPGGGSAFCLCPDHQSPQRTTTRKKEVKNIKHSRKYHFWWEFQHCLTDAALIFS